jgi:hypothetical protein
MVVQVARQVAPTPVVAAEQVAMLVLGVMEEQVEEQAGATARVAEEAVVEMQVLVTLPVVEEGQGFMDKELMV